MAYSGRGTTGQTGSAGSPGSAGSTGAADTSAPIVTALNVTSNTTVSIPAGNIIQHLVIQNSTGNAVTGGIKIGTTDGGVDVVIAVAVGANALFCVLDVTLLKRVFSMSGATILYIQTVTLFNGANLNFYFSCRKIN